MNRIVLFFRYLVFRERSFYPLKETEKRMIYEHSVRRNDDINTMDKIKTKEDHNCD